MTETPTTSEQTRQGTGRPLASEQGHWYAKDGTPVYEVEAKKGGMRDTTLADARKLDLVPSVTNVLNVAAKPGLEAWKAKQILESALTLPRIDGENLDDYALRVVEDSKAQSQKARDKGTELHAAIEAYIQGNLIVEWQHHVKAVSVALNQYGIDMECGKAEHSFASSLGYGGKIDWHNEATLLDFKTTAVIKEGKRLAYDDHVIQLSAYSHGLGLSDDSRLLNVFIGVEDKQVRIVEWSKTDVQRAWKMFLCLLNYWKLLKNFNANTVE